MKGWLLMALLAGLSACEKATASEPAGAPAAIASGAALKPVPLNQLCVTSGAVESHGASRFAVTEPTFRAVSASLAESRAELRFTYLGPTATTRALGSGAVRQQLGLKLRAQDPCNLLYVMWRLEPEAKIAVQVKRNPTDHTSSECGNRGYATIKASTTAPVPAVAPGSSHVLRAELNGATLQVTADGVLVWKGDVGSEVLAIDGPTGVRSDNVHMEAELHTVAKGGAGPCPTGESAE